MWTIVSSWFLAILNFLLTQRNKNPNNKIFGNKPMINLHRGGMPLTVLLNLFLIFHTITLKEKNLLKKTQVWERKIWLWFSLYENYFARVCNFSSKITAWNQWDYMQVWGYTDMEFLLVCVLSLSVDSEIEKYKCVLSTLRYML